MFLYATPDSGNRIYGCYKRNNGQLRIVAELASCNASENEISWDRGDGGPLANHRSEMSFALSFTGVDGDDGAFLDVPLPVTDRPVHIELAAIGLRDNQNVPVAPAVYSDVAVQEASTGQTRLSGAYIPNATFSCGDAVSISENGPDGVRVNYSNSANGTCGEHSVNIHLTMWY